MRRRVAVHRLEMQHKDELQQFAAAAEVQRQQRSADNDNAEHYVAAFRVEQAPNLYLSGMKVTLTLLSVLLNA